MRRNALSLLALLVGALSLTLHLSPRVEAGAFAPARAGMAACGYRTTNVSLNTTATDLTLDSELADTNNIHSGGTFTIPSGGGGTWCFTEDLTGTGASVYYISELYKNGSKITGCEFSQFSYAGGHCQWIVPGLVAGDTITVRLSINTGTSTLTSSGVASNNGGYLTVCAVKI